MSSVYVTQEILKEESIVTAGQRVKRFFQTDNVLLFIPNIIDYMRLLMLMSFAYNAMTGHYSVAVVCYIINFALDECDGKFARFFGQTSVYGMMMDILLDEASILCLCMVLCTIYPQYLIAFQLYSAVDFSAQWANYQYSALYKNNDFSTTDNSLLNMYFNNYIFAVFWVYGNHIFLLMTYLCNFTYGPDISIFGHSLGLWQLVAYVFAPWSISRLCIMLYLLVTSMKNLATEDRLERIRSRDLDDYHDSIEGEDISSGLGAEKHIIQSELKK